MSLLFIRGVYKRVRGDTRSFGFGIAASISSSKFLLVTLNRFSSATCESNFVEYVTNC